MRTLSKKCRYALRALYRLARQKPGETLSIAVLAEEEKLSRKFLEAILVQLRNHQIVESHQGKNGGYNLARDPGQLFLGQIIRAVDGPFEPLPCLSAVKQQTCPECVSEAACQTRAVLREAMAASDSILEQISLAEMERRRLEELQSASNFEI